MRVLALDTATAATTVALWDASAGVELERRDDPAPGARPRHVSSLLGLVDAVLAETGTAWSQVDRIAVGVGPGTFTGLRIGVASAQALARANGIALVGVSTLESLLAGARDAHPDAEPLAVIDARRGEAFVSGVEVPLAPAQLAAHAPGRLAVGDGAIKFRYELEQAGASVPADDSGLHRVSARWHCRLGAALESVPDSLAAVQPSYLRVPDAELTRRRF
ncbi:MAG: tRNA (adenosine(37)-N6)-threonylcarbamoyltransferase complex dimerization subunit type 1 TsaB [Solirubrobacterales bacterium]|nr:tRNA (adenosine(37)-N6)-threonylcarbamoyltransferase complex dimerization subunit type 1 TsaB [Solirubrobacterales bacterium]